MQQFAANATQLTAAPAPKSVGGFGASELFGFGGYWRCAGWQPSFTGFYYRWHSSSQPS